MDGHEGGGTALFAFSPQTGDEVLVVDLVEFEDGHLDLLADVSFTFGLGVNLLLPLLTPTTKAENQVESGLLLDVVVGQGAAICFAHTHAV